MTGYFYKVAIGVGLLALVGLVAVDIWLWQNDDDSSEVGQGSTNESNLPGLPVPGGDTNASSASATDSVILEIQKEGGESESGLIVGDGASIEDSFRLDTTGSGSGTTVGDSASIGDSATTQIEPAQPPPPPQSGGGPSDNASFGDTADLVVRDSAGNIKNQQTVK